MDESLSVFRKIATVFVIINLIVLIPLLAVPLYVNNDTAATAIYMIYSPTCHQYISRSYCFFDAESGWGFGDCIEDGTNPSVATEFTPSKRNYSGIFHFNRMDIGSNRADVVYYTDRIGFKMPVCTRDFGIYLGFLLGMALFLGTKKKMKPFNVWVYGLFLVPLVIDGFAQLLTGYESTNTIRMVTGLIAGGASGVELLALIYPREK
jgi:uncharacterized membrane protein